MTLEDLAFVSFDPKNTHFRGSLSVEAVLASEGDPEARLGNWTSIYERCLDRIRPVLAEIEAARSSPRLVPARAVWRVGDSVFRLRDELEAVGLQLDGVYRHLCRDLGVKRKWLEKAIILRRYLPDVALIPQSLNWGRCEKGTRRVAQRLSRGLSAD